jgi:hypothetical protein
VIVLQGAPIRGALRGRCGALAAVAADAGGKARRVVVEIRALHKKKQST